MELEDPSEGTRSDDAHPMNLIELKQLYIYIEMSVID